MSLKSPNTYRTRYGLYRAALRILEAKPRGWQWWFFNARQHCEREMPDLLPQLDALKESFTPTRVEELIEIV